MNLFRKHVPIVYQIETAECGAASLCMVLRYYERYESLAQLRKDCNVTANGSTMFDLVEAAKKYGFEAKAYSMPAEELTNVQFPAIAYWNHCHYVVIESMTMGQVVVCDPAAGKIKMPFHEFQLHYSGVILRLHPTDAFQKAGTPPSPFRQALSLFRGTEKSLIFLLLLLILTHLICLLLPCLIRNFVDYVLPSEESKDVATFFFISSGLLAARVLSQFLLKNYMLRLNRSGAEKYNTMLIQKVLRLPMRYFEMRRRSELVARLESIGSISTMVISQCIPMIPTIISLVSCIIMLLCIHTIMGISLMLILIVMAVFISYMLSQYKSCKLRARSSALTLNYAVNRYLISAVLMKVSEVDEAFAEDIKKAYLDHSGIRNEIKQCKGIFRALCIAIPIVAQILLLLLGMNLLDQSRITAGLLLSCQFIGIYALTMLVKTLLDIDTMQDQEINLRGLEDIWQEDTLEVQNAADLSKAVVQSYLYSIEKECKKSFKEEIEKVSERKQKSQCSFFRLLWISMREDTKNLIYLVLILSSSVFLGLYFPFSMKSYLELPFGNGSSFIKATAVLLVLLVILVLFMKSNRIVERVFTDVKEKLLQTRATVLPNNMSISGNTMRIKSLLVDTEFINTIELLILSLIPAFYFFSQSLAIIVILLKAMDTTFSQILLPVLGIFLFSLLVHCVSKSRNIAFWEKNRELKKRADELIGGMALLRKEGSEGQAFASYTEFYQNYTDIRIKKDNWENWISILESLLLGLGLLLLFWRIYRNRAAYTERLTVLLGTMYIYLTCALELFRELVSEISGYIRQIRTVISRKDREEKSRVTFE